MLLNNNAGQHTWLLADVSLLPSCKETCVAVVQMQNLALVDCKLTGSLPELWSSMSQVATNVS
jgi:hypothetical protein